jgi:hypothetical protein
MIRLALLSAVLLSLPFSVSAQDNTAPWLRMRDMGAALNPRISAIGDFVGAAAPTRADAGLRLREVELAVQSAVDPYGRFDLYLAKPDGEAFEVEEGYATATALPGGVLVRGGKFRANFGRLNIVHRHELQQVDYPLVVSSYLGEEGLNDVGAEASRAFAPFGLYTELSYAVLQGFGEAEERDPATTTVLDTNGNTVTVRVQEDEPAAPRRARDLGHVGRVRFFQDITDTVNVDLGLSGAIHQPEGFLHRQLGGMDLTFRWKPLQEGQYRSFLWRTEGLYSRRHLPAATDPVTGAQASPAARTDRRGAYSYAEYQADRRWRCGLRSDYLEDPDALGSRGVTRALSPYVTLTVTEFNRLRLQYQRRWTAARPKDDRVFFQWTVALGPHGAHPF